MVLIFSEEGGQNRQGGKRNKPLNVFNKSLGQDRNFSDLLEDRECAKKIAAIFEKAGLFNKSRANGAQENKRFFESLQKLPAALGNLASAKNAVNLEESLIDAIECAALNIGLIGDGTYNRMSNLDSAERAVVHNLALYLMAKVSENAHRLGATAPDSGQYREKISKLQHASDELNEFLTEERLRLRLADFNFNPESSVVLAALLGLPGEN